MAQPVNSNPNTNTDEIHSHPPPYFEIDISPHTPSPPPPRRHHHQEDSNKREDDEILSLACQKRKCLKILIWSVSAIFLFILTLVLLLTLINVSTETTELDIESEPLDSSDEDNSFTSASSLEKRLRDFRKDLGTWLDLLSTDKVAATDTRLNVIKLNQSLQQSLQSFQSVEKELRQHLDSVRNEESRALNSSQDILKKFLNTHHPESEKRSCEDIKPKNDTPGSLLLSKQIIYPFGKKGKAVEVLCDFETKGGGWTIIQRRTKGPKDQFNKDWIHYEQGFSSPDILHGSYWIGLKSIWALSLSEDNESPQTLRIELTDWNGTTRYAEYDSFSLSSPQDSYRLLIDGYSGNAGDSLSYHHWSKFSTRDSDNDQDEKTHCARDRHSGWWFTACSNSNLNGLYWNYNTKIPRGDGIVWYSWTGSEHPLKQVQMKIRSTVPIKQKN